MTIILWCGETILKKLAIIGCGGMVYDFIHDYTKDLAAALSGISGSEKDIRRFSKMYAVPRGFTDYREMLEAVRPDLVMVFPEDELQQFTITKTCLGAGASVLCERPVCHSIAEGEELAELQKETGQFIMPRYNRRYMPAYISAKHIIDRGGLGKAYMYGAAFHSGAYSGEALFVVNHISHHLDLARMLLGEIEILDIRRTAENDRRIGYNIVIQSEKGTLGNIQSNSFLCGDYPVERVELSGDTRQLIVENVRTIRYNQPVRRLESGAADMLAGGGSGVLNMNNAQLNNFAYYGFEDMLKEFVHCSAAGIKPAQDMEDALKTFKQVNLVQKYQKNHAKLVL
jgi:predicted dehydrogenase